MVNLAYYRLSLDPLSTLMSLKLSLYRGRFATKLCYLSTLSTFTTFVLCVISSTNYNSFSQSFPWPFGRLGLGFTALLCYLSSVSRFFGETVTPSTVDTIVQVGKPFILNQLRVDYTDLYLRQSVRSVCL